MVYSCNGIGLNWAHLLADHRQRQSASGGSFPAPSADRRPVPVELAVHRTQAEGWP